MIVESSSLKGRVVAKKANYFIVQPDINSFKNFYHDDLIPNKNFRFLCTSRRRMIHFGMVVNVGDFVVLDSIDWKTNRAVIVELEPRTSFLSRPPVANVTQVVVVLSVKSPDFYVEQASRFLLTAERSKVNVGLILTKTDLISNEELNYLINRLSGWGYKPMVVSMKTGIGVKQIKDKFFNSNLSVLCGPSGVGKSSLINLMISDEIIATGNLSRKLQRGRHTTRNVQLYSLGEGIFVADTPGFNRPDLQCDSLDLQFLFPEFRCQSEVDNCRFRDCLHCDEPGCSFDKSWERYPQYRKLLDENIKSRHLSLED